MVVISCSQLSLRFRTAFETSKTPPFQSWGMQHEQVLFFCQGDRQGCRCSLLALKSQSFGPDMRLDRSGYRLSSPTEPQTLDTAILRRLTLGDPTLADQI